MNNFIVMSLHIINFIESSFQHKKNPKNAFYMLVTIGHKTNNNSIERNTFYLVFFLFELFTFHLMFE